MAVQLLVMLLCLSVCLCVYSVLPLTYVCMYVCMYVGVSIVCVSLCRYTSLVDHYIPNIALCLQDSAPFVRRQTLILLTNLLQEDYVKWRGSLFFHFVMCLVDKEREIKQFGIFCVASLSVCMSVCLSVALVLLFLYKNSILWIFSLAKFCLVHLTRHPEMFYQHFVQCIFQFNGYETHPCNKCKECL